MSTYNIVSEYVAEGQMTVEQRLRLLEANQKTILENQNHIKESLKALQESNLTAMSKIYAVLDQIKKSGPQNVLRTTFPVKSLAELSELNSLCCQDPTQYAQLMKSITTPDGIVKSLHRIIDRNFIQSLNYDGVSKKYALKDYTSFNASLYEALKKDGYTEKEYIRDIRTAFKNNKNIFYKKKCEDLKKSTNNT